MQGKNEHKQSKKAMWMDGRMDGWMDGWMYGWMDINLIEFKQDC
jgi:hypothetical protein